MKIIYLNTWDAEVFTPLSDFIKKHAQDTDVFCFQEVYGSMPALCDEVLKEYRKITAHKYVTEADDFYQAMYVRNNVEVVFSGEVLEDQKDVGLGVYVQIKQKHNDLYICNFHGISRPIDKRDTPERLKQSQDVINFFRDKEGPKVIGGDFNVFPSNPSIHLYPKSGYRDLIHDFKVTNTRNRLVWERYPENEKQYFSDYVFVSDGVGVDTFTVPNVEVSDHLPLILEMTS
jgi:endonuclease/exonuclease/phosphatase (EEP) superfamily protein YafD